MDLWIRSQNREMLRINPELEIYEYGNKKFLVIDTKGYINYDKAKVLGEYKTKERALEVLDEIQNILKPKYILDSSSIRPDGDSWVENGIIMQKYNTNARIEGIPIYVYEMPEE